MKKNLNGFIFDLDGVLTNTSEYHYLAWKKLADELEIPFDRKMNENFKGVSRRDCLALLLGNREISKKEFEVLLERKNRYYRDFLIGVSEDSLFPGTLRLFEEIHSIGGRIAIASVSKNTREIVKRLCIDEKADIILDGYSVEKTKPEPDQFLLAARLLHAEPSECVVFEDARAGIEAAKRAGMFAVGIGAKEELPHADIVYESIGEIELEELIEAVNNL